jgi:hypothetical protein
MVIVNRKSQFKWMKISAFIFLQMKCGSCSGNTSRFFLAEGFSCSNAELTAKGGLSVDRQNVSADKLSASQSTGTETC